MQSNRKLSLEEEKREEKNGDKNVNYFNQHNCCGSTEFPPRQKRN